MLTVALIGFLGGLITGISPCILPVLPVVFFSGVNGTREKTPAARPYLVIAGLVCSFGAVTLAGSALLSALHLPQDAIRWAALVTLTVIGLGLIFPPLQHLIERPFARIPQRQFGSDKPQKWFRAGPDAGRVVCAVRGAGAGRDRGSRRNRVNRTADACPDRDVRHRYRTAAAGFRAGRAARCGTGRRIPAPPARSSDRRRDHDDRAGRRAGLQPARNAAARRPRLHRGHAAKLWGPQTSIRAAQAVSWPTVPRALSSCNSAVRRPPSAASPSGSTPRTANRSTWRRCGARWS